MQSIDWHIASSLSHSALNCLIAALRSETLEAFDEVLNVVRLADGIATTETSILLSTYKI